MINFSNATFVKSCPNRNDRPQGNTPEVLIVGKSNVGKSSLINALCKKKRLAFTSSKPGHTRLLNYYDIDKRFYLVDAPGYGYAKTGVNLDKLFGEMMESYFDNNQELKLVLVLLDSRRDFSPDDLEIISYLKENDIPYYLVITKTDKINQKEKAALSKRIKSQEIASEIVYQTSSLDDLGLETLKKGIEKLL